MARLDAIGDVRTSGSIGFYLAVAKRELGDLARAVQLVHDGVQVKMACQDRRQLSAGVYAALLLISERAEPEKRARLLGAADALRQATGFTSIAWERISGQSMARLREQLEQEGWAAACREGRSLSLEDVATLTLALLDDVAQTLSPPATAAAPALPASPLSAREREVLRLVAEGLSSKAIGRQLFIVPSTVNYHLASIFRKLASRAAPRRWPWRRGTASYRQASSTGRFRARAAALLATEHPTRLARGLGMDRRPAAPA